MKLILVNRYFHPDISATSQLATDFAIDQAARGREVHVVTSGQLYEDAGAPLPAEETFQGVHIHRAWSTRFGRGSLAGRAVDYATFYLTARNHLMRLAGRGDVIVAKTDPPLISAAAVGAAHRRGARYVNWLQDLFPEVAEELGVRVPFVGIARRMRDESLRAAAANVAVGERMAARIEALGAKATVIANWADGRLVHPVEHADNPLRNAWGLGERFVVAYSGNMGRAHEFDTLLDACAALRAEQDILFLFIGAGRQRAWIEREAARRGLGNIAFQPYQPRAALARSLSAGDVHVVTLKPALEGLIVPSKFYGIAAAGRPALFIGDPRGEIATEIAREQCGFAIASGDREALVAALKALRDDRALRLEMGRRARSAFERRHERALALEAWNKVLQQTY